MDAKMIIARFNRLAAEYTTYHAHCREVAELMLPGQALNFNGAMGVQGGKRMSKILDAEAAHALQDGCAVFEGRMMPQGSYYNRLAARDPELMKLQHVRAWFENKTMLLFGLRNAPSSNFAGQAHSSVEALMAFGMQSMWPDLLMVGGAPAGIIYRSEPIGSIFVEENFQGQVDATFRTFDLSVRQAMQKWGDKAPECAKKAYRDASGNEAKLAAKHKYLHAIFPRTDAAPGRIDALGMPYASVHISMADRELIDEGGYRAMPRIVSRWETSPGEVTGRSRAMLALPDVKSAQEAMAELMTAIAFVGRPTLLAEDDTMDQVINYVAGDVIYGGMSNGRRMIEPLFEGVDVTPLMQIVEMVRGSIRRAFYADMLTGRDDLKSHVTAAALMDKKADQGLMLSPFNRQEGEWFLPLIQREIDLMAVMGLLDDMPGEVAESGGAYQVIFDNMQSRSHMAEGAAAVMQLREAVAAMAQFDPGAIKIMQSLYPDQKIVPYLGRAMGVPVELEATDEERAAVMAQEQEAAMAQQALEAAPVLTKVAADLNGMEGADAFAA